MCRRENHLKTSPIVEQPRATTGRCVHVQVSVFACTYASAYPCPVLGTQNILKWSQAGIGVPRTNS